MIQTADAMMRAWVKAILGDQIAVGTFPRNGAASPDGTAGAAVGLELLDILAAAPPPRTNRRPPLACQVRYLVTTWAATPEAAHELLGKLLFAALDDEARTAELPIEADLAPIPPETWLALQAPQRPAFAVRLPLTVDRVVPHAPRVTTLPISKLVDVTTIYGSVVGPDDYPIAGATVVLLTTGQSIQTDYRGRFRFSMVPIRAVSQKLEIRAKGDVQQFDAPVTHSGGEPMLLRFQIREG